MGFRVNSQVAAGFSAIERLKKQNPSREKVESPVKSQSDIRSLSLFSADQSQVPENYEVQLSSTLKSAITLGRLENENRDLSKAFGSFTTIENDREKAIRRASTEGIGDRAVALTNTPTEGADRFFRTTTLNDPNPEETQADVRQKDISQLREAIVQVAYDFVAGNPTATEEEVQDQVDAEFGEGIAEYFEVTLQDDGAGKSSINTKQVEADEVGYGEDQELVDEAVAIARENFKPRESEFSLKGSDVKALLSEVESSLGYKGINLVKDLRAALASPNDLELAFEKASEELEFVGASEEQKAKAAEAIEKLKDLAKDVTDSFDQNTLFDNSKKSYTSNRYGPAFGRDQVDEIASLTENAEWIANGGPRTD